MKSSNNDNWFYLNINFVSVISSLYNATFPNKLMGEIYISIP